MPNKVVFDRIEYVEVFRVVSESGEIIEELRVGGKNSTPLVAFSGTSIKTLQEKLEEKAISVQEALEKEKANG